MGTALERGSKEELGRTVTVLESLQKSMRSLPGHPLEIPTSVLPFFLSFLLPLTGRSQHSRNYARPSNLRSATQAFRPPFPSLAGAATDLIPFRPMSALLLIGPATAR